MLKWIAVILTAAAVAQTAPAPTPQFADPSRRETLATAFDDIDRLFTEFARSGHVPGAAWGIVALDQEVRGDPLFGSVEQAFNASADEVAQAPTDDAPPAGDAPTGPTDTGGTDSGGTDGGSGDTGGTDGGSEPTSPTTPTTLPPPITPPPTSEPKAIV